MDERVKFIARLLDGEPMAGLCEEFSISRKTGYKILKRCRDCCVEGLTDRSRRPYRQAAPAADREADRPAEAEKRRNRVQLVALRRRRNEFGFGSQG